MKKCIICVCKIITESNKLEESRTSNINKKNEQEKSNIKYLEYCFNQFLFK
jgi:hypothetical protein